APAKKAPAKKAPAKKAPAKKAPAKKTSSVTTPAQTSVASTPRVSADVTRPKAAVKVAGTASASVQLAVREDEDPWTEAELTEIREQLSEELDNLSLELAAMRRELDELMSEVADAAGDDQADTGSKTYEREHEMSLMASVTDMREQVQHALTMVDSGEYGRCESCENPIGKVRLQAFPRATLCLSCKQRQERR
ncbi:MAG: TraR/DksA C4-type zinc finger protein, partial [Actinomycetia bacterium]|nr:TraR/DksA C4-type zinc finger protein [Actinomycetes bacterium]